MVSRRRFITAGVVAGVGAAAGAAWMADRAAKDAYAEALQNTWRPLDVRGTEHLARMRELVRMATLAPSSHNTQCWRFAIGARAITLRPDFSRRCPAVDPDDHHLFVSLGCAAENLVQSAAAMGFRATPMFDAATGAIEVALAPAEARPSALVDAIPLRQSTRAAFDGRPLPSEALSRLREVSEGDGVNVVLLTERRAMESVLDFVVRGNTTQMRDPAFVRELKHWLRFNGAQAAATGDGLFAASSGNPTAPAWLGSRLFDQFFTEQAENDKYARHIRSSAGIAVFVSERDDRAHWVAAGRAFQRFALQATALGIRNAHLNQPIEVASLRPEFTRLVGATSGRPDLVIRFGRGPEMPRSLRRPVDAVLA